MNTTSSILQKVRYSVAESEPFTFYIKRDDLIDPIISGNKWRKLKYNIELAKSRKAIGLLTFGGAFSNHLVATAKACANHGFKSIGIVRGEELSPNVNETLKKCKSYGMELRFISRAAYKKRNEYSFIKSLQYEHSDFTIVSEGGANFYGVVGCQEILKETPNDFDHIYIAAGTGATAAGVALSMNLKTQLHVISALKGDFLQHEITKLINLIYNDNQTTNALMERVTIISDSQFGGYGKWNHSLVNLIQSIYNQTNLKLEPIYTGKVFYNMLKDWSNKQIQEDDKVLFVHTGGLQGISGVERKLGYQLF